ncbi:MAG TPA: L-threonylcarbamoyladenylate synthase [Cyclobacteriaceae bacterium]|nr:L-threonylcarbamoyladenylate synthase [Cyclobacteriaceae bacterium]
MAEIGDNIARARKLLDSGNLVAIPTETVYGLAGNAYEPAVVTEIFAVKDRPTFDPLIVHTDRIDKIGNFAQEIPEKLRILAENFWPGPLTLILKKKEIIPDIITSGLDTVAVRMPRHPLTLELLSGLDYPLAAPSANPFGYVSPTTAEHVNRQLGTRIRYILDGGPCSVGIESTIIGCEEGNPVVYRLGGKSIEKIEAIIGPVEIRTREYPGIIAPGMLKSHYAPAKKVILFDHDLPAMNVVAANAGILSFNKLRDEVPAENQYMLSGNSDLKEAGKNLFTGLRFLDNLDIQIIYAELVPETGIGKAINDRLRRAAARL